MCGIAGSFHFDRDRAVSPDGLRAMADSIAHRGPDAEGLWLGHGIGLAHRRLSIIDLAEGQQPMSDASETIHVVFNGEIYNYKELRRILIQRGHPLRTHSDTEVLLYLYRDHGAEMVHYLRGMFALAIWDARQEALLLARDRVGQKPLYYCASEESVLFGSEIKALLCDPAVDRSIDPQALDAYLAYGFIPGSLSIFQSIRKLPPAHVLQVKRSAGVAGEPRRYWRLESQVDHSRSVDDWKEAIREKLDETVYSHRIADVPVGAFLSGGVDSSAIVAAMASRSAGTLKTFSIGFEEESFSELPYARQVSTRYGTEHIEQIVTPDIAADFERLIHHYDEPFADSSALPTMAVARVARQYVKVVISGDGGDEAFGGYSRYLHDLREAQVRRWLLGWVRRQLLGRMADLWPRTDWLPRPLRLKSALANLSCPADAAYAKTLAINSGAERGRIFGWSAEHGAAAERFVSQAYSMDVDDLKAMTECDIALVLPDDFLVKVDRASMAVGLEVRPPMVDHEFLEFTASIPSKYKVHQGQGKWIFKQAVANQLPPDILSRKKMGFEIPVDQWMRGPLREQLEATLSPSGPLSGLLNTGVLRGLYQSHLRQTGRYGNLLWMMLVLGQWLDHYTSGRVDAGTSSTGAQSSASKENLPIS